MVYVPRRKPYQHPGRLFNAEHGIPTEVEDIAAYARFLRQGKIFVPVRLRAITWRFGIRKEFFSLPSTEKLDGLADHETGIVYINQQHSEERQRFTIAHELMELLFSACEESPEWETSIFAANSADKERLCNKGAAALLIPARTLLSHLHDTQPSLELASNLAREYKTSLTACVHRLVEVSPDPWAMIIWHCPSDGLRYFSSDANRNDLQVWWSEPPHYVGTFMRGQAAPEQSLIRTVYETHQPLVGTEILMIGHLQGEFLIEARKVTLGDKKCVLSLVKLVER